MNRLFVIINIVVIFAALSVYWKRGDKRMSCIFCDIVNKKTSTEFLFENDEFVAFRDIKPASTFHFLIIPKKHIMNTSSLTVDDKPMRKINSYFQSYQMMMNFPFYF
jgi:galactose-1-phosphate uridylyltransferase